MATISIPLGVNTVVRSGERNLTIDSGVICTIFALSRDGSEAIRELSLIIAEAQTIIGRIAFDTTSEPVGSLVEWSKLSHAHSMLDRTNGGDSVDSTH